VSLDFLSLTVGTWFVECLYTHLSTHTHIYLYLLYTYTHVPTRFFSPSLCTHNITNTTTLQSTTTNSVQHTDMHNNSRHINARWEATNLGKGLQTITDAKQESHSSHVRVRWILIEKNLRQRLGRAKRRRNTERRDQVHGCVSVPQRERAIERERWRASERERERERRRKKKLQIERGCGRVWAQKTHCELMCE
jgi:hypothetical protein